MVPSELAASGPFPQITPPFITGATGCGKTWLGCALAHQAARAGFSVLYTRAARLFGELQVAHGDGGYGRRMTQLAKLDLLLIDH